jgi:PAS domain S-box-containing protein
MELSNEQLQLLVKCAPEPAVIYLMEDEESPPVPFLYTTDAPAFSGLTEQEYLELYQSDATKVVLPQDFPALQNTIKQIFTENNSGVCTYRTYHKMKGTIWTHTALKWIGEFEGKHVLFGIFTDVSNQVAEDTPGGFFIYAAQEDDQFFFVGENMLRMLGYSREEFQIKFQNRFRYMVYAADREETLKSIDNQIAENGHYDKVDYRIEKKDGSLLWVHDEGHYVVDKDGRSWFYVTINDMSDLVEEHEKLQKENTELGTIINSIPVGLSVYRLEKNQVLLVAVNDAVCEILGVTSEQMKDGTQSLFTDRVHPDDLPELIKTMHRVRTAGRHNSPPFRYAGQNQDWKWLRIEAETVTMADGTLFIYNVITDLTAERLAEEKLEIAHRVQQEQFQSSLKALVLANPQSLCTVRLNLSLNKCEEWYGTSPFVIHTIQAETAEGVIENISHIIINEKDRVKFRNHFDRAALIHAFRNGKKRDIVRYRRTIEDGTSIWVETVVNMVENPDTHEIEAVLFSENVNDQVLNEEIIQKSTDTGYEYIATLQLPKQIFRFRFLGDFIPQQYRELYKDSHQPRSFAEIVDVAVRTWVSPDEIEHFQEEAAIESIIGHLSKSDSYTITIKSRQADGSEGWKQIRLTWLVETKDWILIQQADISDAIHRQQADLIERLNTERALRNEADRANESKSNFISNVSHDMRTPLNAILGYDRLALEATSAEVRIDYLKKIGAAGETLLSLINDTLDLQKIENGVTTLHPAPVSCSAIVNGILTAVKPLMDVKRIHFVFDNSKAVWAMLNVDAMRVEEIFINLLSNAAKFTPEGGEVLLSMECEKETENEIYSKLVVRDNGVGISQGFIAKIYEPFAQERNEKTAGIGGSGLGLSIVKRLVDLMHGRIEVKSKLGEGTEFAVYLTFSKAGRQIDSNQDAQKGKQLMLCGKTILLCEDNEMNREIATAILEKNGMSVIPAVNGEEGVQRFIESGIGEISAVLMDIRMPVMDGYEASKAIRASSHPDSKKVPVIALSADAYNGDIQKARECGMNSHLSKPIDPEMLLQTLHADIQRAERKDQADSE